jgi:electron transport complex protein RnfE
MKNSVKILTNGIIRENPVLVMLLAICPTLAVTVAAVNGIGLGIATTFVLVCSNVTVSLLKGIIPNKVRLPCYIVTIAGFVTFVDRMVSAFVPALYDSLGIFLPLIATNCVVFGRAESFASKNSASHSALDGLGMGLGFTLALFLMGSIREILGSGTFMTGTPFALELPILSENPMLLFIFPAGGFFTFAMIIVIMNKITKKPPREIGCAGCPSRNTCAKNRQNLDGQSK